MNARSGFLAFKHFGFFYRIAPMLKMSLTGFRYLKLLICPGGMKTGVPAVFPVMLMPLSPAIWKLFDIPKSAG